MHSPGKTNENAFYKKPEKKQHKTFLSDKEQIIPIKNSKNEEIQTKNIQKKTNLNDPSKNKTYVKGGNGKRGKEPEISLQLDIKKESKCHAVRIYGRLI